MPPPTGIPDIHQVPSDTAAIPSAIPSAPVTAFPIWPLGTTLDLHVYITTSPNPWHAFTQESKRGMLSKFSWENIQYGDWEDTRIWESEIYPPPVCQIFMLCDLGIHRVLSPIVCTAQRDGNLGPNVYHRKPYRPEPFLS